MRRPAAWSARAAESALARRPGLGARVAPASPSAPASVPERRRPATAHGRATGTALAAAAARRCRGVRAADRGPAPDAAVLRRRARGRTRRLDRGRGTAGRDRRGRRHDRGRLARGRHLEQRVGAHEPLADLHAERVERARERAPAASGAREHAARPPGTSARSAGSLSYIAFSVARQRRQWRRCGRSRR